MHSSLYTSSIMGRKCAAGWNDESCPEPGAAVSKSCVWAMCSEHMGSISMEEPLLWRTAADAAMDSAWNELQAGHQTDSGKRSLSPNNQQAEARRQPDPGAPSS